MAKEKIKYSENFRFVFSIFREVMSKIILNLLQEVEYTVIRFFALSKVE